jgi:hypothetical protein
MIGDYAALPCWSRRDTQNAETRSVHDHGNVKQSLKTSLVVTGAARGVVSGISIRLPLPDAEEETSAAKEPQTSDETDESESGRSPQKGLEKVHGTAGGTRL